MTGFRQEIRNAMEIRRPVRNRQPRGTHGWMYNACAVEASGRCSLLGSLVGRSVGRHLQW